MAGPALLVDLYELTMAQCYFDARKGRSASFDLFARGLPKGRGFLVAAGLADVLEYAAGLSFSKDDISYLRSLKLFSADFLAYLAKLRFTGDIWAMPEGTVFFANEPVIRVTADIVQAQLVESYLLNTVNVQTMLASKACRVTLAARGRPVYDFSLRRTHGSDAAMKAARCSYIAGFAGSSNVLAGRLYGIPVAGTMAHSFVMSFGSEREAFAVYCRVFPDKSVLLVDTYDTIAGVRNAVRAGLELRAKGHRLLGIRLDSGDLVRLSIRARKMLDEAGLADVKIMASGNLDEWAIGNLISAGARIDSFGVGTRMGASVDAPALDLIYKLSEVSDGTGRFFPAMKLSKGKVTYPGRKQVYRVTDAKGNLRRDIIGLEKEPVRGTRLLVKVMERGKKRGSAPSLERIRRTTAESLARLPARLREPGADAAEYPVTVSAGLASLTRRLSGRLRKI